MPRFTPKRIPPMQCEACPRTAQVRISFNLAGSRAKNEQIRRNWCPACYREIMLAMVLADEVNVRTIWTYPAKR